MHALSITKPRARLQMGEKISSFVAGVFCLAFCLLAGAQGFADTLERMTVEQKVGQLMIWSFHGTGLTPELKETLNHYQPGALIVFGRNVTSPAQIERFNTQVQAHAKRRLKAPLFLMVDQEGGLVTRVRMSTPLPSALALGKTEDPKFVENFARTKAELLRALGFNVNLAPVLDISNPEKDSFIGNRTFGDNPNTVSELGVAYAKGLSEGGVLPTAKHFPGHGNTVADSHKTVPKKNASLEELQKKDLVPFQQFAETERPQLIMMAHLALPKVDPSGVPATYSRPIIQKHLREKLGFSGIVITDDLEMSGASISPDIGERAVRAFLAGNDMLMFAGPLRHQRKAYRDVLAAVNSGRISMDRLNESVRRILATKATLNPPAKSERKTSAALIKRLDELSREAMQRNFKYAFEARAKNWPSVGANDKVLVLGASLGFYNAFKSTYRHPSRFFYLSPDTMANAIAEMTRYEPSLIVFYASGAKTARFVSQSDAELKAKMIVINCNHPGEIEDQDSFLAVLNLHSHSPESGGWLAQELIAPSELRLPAADPEPSSSSAPEDP